MLKSDIQENCLKALATFMCLIGATSLAHIDQLQAITIKAIRCFRKTFYTNMLPRRDVLSTCLERSASHDEE